MTARVSMLLKSRASPDMLPFSLCNKKRLAIRHMNRSLFLTTLQILSYDIGKWVRLRACQHPPVLSLVNKASLLLHTSFLMVLQTCSGLDHLTVEDSSSHTIRHTQSVGFLSVRDQLDPATSTAKHTMLTRDRHPFHRRDSDPQSHPNNRAAADPHLTSTCCLCIYVPSGLT